MILKIIIQKTDDGCTAEMPSIKGCECWAEDEERALEKIVSLARYYLKLSDSHPLKIDKARGTFTEWQYNLIFDK